MYQIQRYLKNIVFLIHLANRHQRFRLKLSHSVCRHNLLWFTKLPCQQVLKMRLVRWKYSECKRTIFVVNECGISIFLSRNCVSTVNLGCELNLQNINFRTRNSEYNPSRFHGVVMRIRDPRCTALIFKSGKLVCTGARNEELANLGTRKFARIIQKLGYTVRVCRVCALKEQKSSSFPFETFF